jgi:hypothetical protein
MAESRSIGVYIYARSTYTVPRLAATIDTDADPKIGSSLNSLAVMREPSSTPLSVRHAIWLMVARRVPGSKELRALPRQTRKGVAHQLD